VAAGSTDHARDAAHRDGGENRFQLRVERFTSRGETFAADHEQLQQSNLAGLIAFARQLFVFIEQRHSAGRNRLCGLHRNRIARVRRTHTGLEREPSGRQRNVLEAEAALASAEAAVRGAEARLAAMGFSAPSGDSQRGDPVVTVTSPIAGTVIERTAAADAPVGPDSVLFTIVDLSSLWLTVRVPETSASAIRRGQNVSVVVGAMPDRPVEGRVDYIAPIVAPETRTVDVRVQVPNRTRELRPGMSASARFELPDRTTASSSEPRVLVPRTAVQELNQSSVVFVPTGDRQFKPQQVTLGSSYGNDVEVVSGVKVGDRIVVQGAFTLKAQAMRGAVADPH